MTRSVAVGLIVSLVAVLMGAATPASAALHEQIVFAGEANGTFNSVSTDAGFWI
jgi:hypothetical protein